MILEIQKSGFQSEESASDADSSENISEPQEDAEFSEDQNEAPSNTPKKKVVIQPKGMFGPKIVAAKSEDPLKQNPKNYLN